MYLHPPVSPRCCYKTQDLSHRHQTLPYTGASFQTLPIAESLGISKNLLILTYCMADGFTDVILPTNPVLLIGLSMANVSYWKWLKWTWKLQLLLLVISVLVLAFGIAIGY